MRKRENKGSENDCVTAYQGFFSHTTSRWPSILQLLRMIGQLKDVKPHFTNKINGKKTAS